MKYKLAFIGFGTVGQGLAEILSEKKEELEKRYGLEYSVVAISDPIKGCIYDAEGLNMEQILNLAKKNAKLDNYSTGIKSWDSLRTIKESNANVIVEVSYTNIETGEPGLTHIREALSHQKHVITTNKGPVALAYRELLGLARANNVSFRFEGAVLAGTPALNLSLEAMAGIRIKEIKGLVNGTTNYILTEMERGRTYQEVLKEAQELGYAEAKPDADVEGWDAVAKAVILANSVMGGNIKVSDVEREGITQITLEKVSEAKTEDSCWKLICRVWQEDDAIKAKVSPEKVPLTDFLANVKGATNALTFVTDYLGEVTIVGPGAGRKETGFSLLSDLLAIHRLEPGK